MTLVIRDTSSAQIVCGTPLIAAKYAADPTAKQITKWDKKVKRGISIILQWSNAVAAAMNQSSGHRVPIAPALVFLSGRESDRYGDRDPAPGHEDHEKGQQFQHSCLRMC
jgi:hypothetical protein